MTYDREALSNPFYAEDIINNLEHQLRVAKTRIESLEQQVEDTILSKEELYSMFLDAQQKIEHNASGWFNAVHEKNEWKAKCIELGLTSDFIIKNLKNENDTRSTCEK